MLYADHATFEFDLLRPSAFRALNPNGYRGSCSDRRADKRFDERALLADVSALSLTLMKMAGSIIPAKIDKSP